MSTNELIEMFELEVWLYLDNDLPESRMDFWSEKINSQKGISEIYLNAKNTLNLIGKGNSEFDISDEKFDEILDTAISKKSKILPINFLEKKSIDKNVSNGKLIFVLTAIAASIVIFFMIPKNAKNVENVIDNYSWNSNKIDSQLYKVSTNVKSIKEQKFNSALYRSYSLNGWENRVTSIQMKIKKLEKQINQKSL